MKSYDEKQFTHGSNTIELRRLESPRKKRIEQNKCISREDILYATERKEMMAPYITVLRNA